MRNYNQYWYGQLTIANRAQVERLLNEVLKDYFTIVAYKPEHPYSRCQVETGERLYSDPNKKAVSVALTEDGKYVYVSIHTSYGVWMFDSREPVREHLTPEDKYENAYLVFEGNKVTIWHKAPCGDQLCWIFKQEYHEPAE